MSTKRKGWHEYFMNLAELTSTRGTCDRARVGCVLVKDKLVIAGGYNGSLPGADHCDDIGHFMQEGHCRRTNHSEANMIASAAKRGVSTDGGVLYCTHTPCITCLKLLVAAGVHTVYYLNEYRIEDVPDFVKEKVRLVKFNKNLDTLNEVIVRKDYL
ncbi:MAG: cytidine/deoxycytidylate deaminase family protein [Candidatus Paceibacterota bacterium]